MDPLLLILLVIVVAVALGLAAIVLRVRAQRRGAVNVVNAHPGELVLPTALLGSSARAVALLADGKGLSFRDAADTEVMRIAADRIMSVEFAPLNARSPIRPARVTLIDGAPVDFLLGVPADSQAEAVIAIRTALGRSAG